MPPQPAPGPVDPEPVELPADAIEVGRIAGAWGVKGWFRVQPYSAVPEALLCAKGWYLRLMVAKGVAAGAFPPPSPFPASLSVPALVSATPARLLRMCEARAHAGAVVACAHGIGDRHEAEALRGARVFIPRSDFPDTSDGEYYWVDLIGLDVVNREGGMLGRVRELVTAGPQTVLVLTAGQAGGKTLERMIPFVAACVDTVDLVARRIMVDWQADY